MKLNFKQDINIFDPTVLILLEKLENARKEDFFLFVLIKFEQ